MEPKPTPTPTPDPTPNQAAPLWRLVTLRRFPRVAAIMRVKPSDLSWPEIYRLQARLRVRVRVRGRVRVRARV